MFSFKKVSKTSHSEMRDIAARICRDYLHGAWKTIAAEDIQLRRISGGLSNFLYYVSLPDSVANTPPSTASPIVANKRPRKDSESNNNNNNHNSGRLQLDDELHQHHQTREPKEVLLRIYGQAHGEHALEAMLTESVVFALLSERRLGPKLHGIFPGGRIEQYIPARPLKTGELADRRISSKIAEKMAEIHCLDIPVSKEPDWIWKTSHRWLVSIENMLNNNNNNNLNNNTNESSTTATGIQDDSSRQEIKSRMRKIDFKREVQWLRDQLKDENFLVVFSHNDLQEGNILIRDKAENTFADTSETTLSDFEESSSRLDAILINPGNGSASTEKAVSRKRNKSSCDGTEAVPELIGRRAVAGSPDDIVTAEHDEQQEEEEPELMFIDFEYCSYNYRGFDLANHFLEWTFDYTNKDYPFFFHKKAQFPNEEQKKAFLDMYLKTSHRITGDDSSSIPANGTVDPQGERDLVEREINFFKCASHLFWSLWACVYCDQEIEFGYWEYADCRMKEYFEAKEKYMMRYKKGTTSTQQVENGL